jgi:NAD(P)H-dependent flavin oxidoreductase YrpB (nitropropane dioxygenase family)
MITRLTRELGMLYPVFSAGMARVSQAPLVAAVSEAGGMGCLGGVSYMPEALETEIRRIRSRTSRHFAVNLLTSDTAAESDAVTAWNSLSDEQREKLKGIEPLLTPGAAAAQIEVALSERPAVIVLTFGTPRNLVEACHARGIKVMAMCGSLGAALEAEAAGVDCVVAQGTEGGGHTGHVGTLALVPTVADAVRIPVVAAGGIVDGRGLAAALCLGAEAVWCGTRFIASEEAYGHARYKQRVLEGEARDTVLSAAYSGKSMRAFRNSWTSTQHHPVSFPAQYAAAAERVESGYQDGDMEEGMMPVGQGVGLVREILPAGEIVRQMAHEASEILRRGGLRRFDG